MVEQQNKIVEEMITGSRGREKGVNSDNIARDDNNTDATNDLSRSSSSSMQILRKILEIEEWKKSSEVLELRLVKKKSSTIHKL